jgi:PadR family transcriptional regulator AphA
MSARSISFRHFILGLLAQQPMSGYDVKRVFERLSWLVGNPSFGSLYPALHALRDEGLVTVKVDEREDKPSRKVYSITDAGKTALEEWINQPIGSDASTKAFVMRLILADNYSHSGLITQLHQRRAQVATQCAALEERAGPREREVDFGKRLALDYGRALASTELAWLDNTLKRLFQQPLPTEGVPGV